MYTIGISAYYHDSSACLFKDDKLLFACEEEKFSGIKHDSSFPTLVLEYIFKKYGITKKDINAVCYYEDPKLKLHRVNKNIKKNIIKYPLYCLKSYFRIKNNIRELDKKLKEISDNVFYSTHHDSHVYYSYYTSEFGPAHILSVDGVGEVDTISFGVFNEDMKKIETTSLATYPHSLGLYYSAMTSFLGFRPNEGEYKVMGLASYGNPDIYYEKVSKLITYVGYKLKCDMKTFTWDTSNKIMFNENLSHILGVEQRLPDEELTQVHKDLAAAVQKKYEEILFKILKMISLPYDNVNLCLGGGCAYNGTANGKIVSRTQYKNLWIPPAPSDAGSAIGAVVNYIANSTGFNNKLSQNPFLGPKFYEDDIIKACKNKKFHRFHFENKLYRFIANELYQGKVVGWYQGHCEFGSRALGNRSILANPTLDGMKDRINKVIKKREGFRPFAPMVIKEKQNDFFEMFGDIPYMNQVVKVKPEYVNKLKAVTHVDGTARVQTVYKNTQMHALLGEFEKLSGYPILLNTSFNIKDKTMVLTPKDAVETFMDTDMDILVMGNFVITK